MSRLGVQFLLGVNRILPSPALPDPRDTAQVTRWQYQTSDLLMKLWGMAGGGAPRTVLDLASGRGGKSVRIAESVPPETQVIAMDLSLEHLERAAVFHREAGWESITKIGGDGEHLPFAPGVFDRIVCTDLLEHLENPRAVLREMRRCLKPDGRVVLIFNPWGSPRGSHLGNVLRLPWCQLFFARETLEEATLTETRRMAAGMQTDEERESIEEFGRGLVEFFGNHVHPTRIRDFREWIQKDGQFTSELELHAGPRPLGETGWLRLRLFEEWLTASYGTILRPIGS
jgi:ubiquinone/menaquinone biosynthesis C-methylase UbiE